MAYQIYMGIPEMEELWHSLHTRYRAGAMRMYWVYGPEKNSITVIGLEPHPEDSKHSSYDRIKLSELPPFQK